MKHYRTSLPPLDQLIFFEAVRRHGSFTRAADELMVSQAAVSKRIRQLENWLGLSLFDRTAQKLQPTVQGRILGERVGNALDFLSTSLEKLRQPHESAVRIGAMTVIGMFWLQPRLQNFALSDAGNPFSLTLNDNMSQLLEGNFDLLIIYGDGHFPRWKLHLLMEEELVPVASPSLAAQLQAGEICQAVLLEYRRQGPEWINWAAWQQKYELAFAGQFIFHHCASYTQSIGMALAGKGIALGSLSILDNEIKQGRLVCLNDQILKTGRAYWLAHREGVMLNEATTAILTALK